MDKNGYKSLRSVPSLLSLLASSIDNASGKAPIYDQSCTELHRSATAEDSNFRINRLRRVYNILLFSAPSYEEEIKIFEEGHGVSALQAANFSGETCKDEPAHVSGLLSAVIFSFRRARRYDPANALEGLVDMLLSHCNINDRWLIVRALRLLVALSSIDDQDIDGREVIGCLGQRFLASLYSNTNPAKRSNNGPWQDGDTTLCMDQVEDEHGSLNLSRAIFSFDNWESELQDQRQDQGLNRSAVKDQASERMQFSDVSRGRYLLPTDCILHSDSKAAACTNGTGELGIDRIPWFTCTELSSERSIPTLERTSSLDRFLSAVIDAPLSPTAWTTAWDSSAGGNSASPLDHSISGGLPVTCFGCGDAREAVHDQTGGHDQRRFRVDSVDLCGALHPSRSGVDSRSSVVRELRLALSLPEIGKSPKILLDEVGHGLATSTQTGSLHGNTECAVGQTTQTLPGPPNTPPRPIGPSEQVELRRSNGQQSGWLGARGMPDPLQMRGSPPSHTFSPGDEDTETTEDMQQSIRLEPVGWELSEARWNHPAVPREPLASAPLLTREGGPDSRAFEICYQEYYGEAFGEGMPPALTEAAMVQRALAVMHGVPSETFCFDTQRACMLVSTGHGGQAASGAKDSALQGLRSPTMVRPRPRIPGVSATSLASLLEDFAEAGTWYRRVEDFAVHLVRRSSKPGQVAQALGSELKRQLTNFVAELLGIAGDVSGAGDCLVGDGAKGLAPPAIDSPNSLSLTQLLGRTWKLRREVRALAGICGLLERDLAPEGGVQGVVDGFPRGGSLLTYLYKCAETTVVSDTSTVVTPGKSLVLALLTSATAPYLAMLSRWLWLGEIWPEDDPFEEFPIRCRDKLGVATQRAGDCFIIEVPWLQDGGNNFMTEGFSENTDARVPCFLNDVWTAAVRAGKLLHMLKHSSPEFYKSCTASPLPPLSLVFDIRALEDREAMFSRLALARMAASRSAVREIRGVLDEQASRKVPDRQACEGALSQKESIPEMPELPQTEANRETDGVSIREARKKGIREVGGRGLVVSALNCPPYPSEASPALPNKQGMLSSLGTTTPEARQQAMDALRERYHLLSKAADERAARANWLRSRKQRAVASRKALKSLYAAEATAWEAEAIGRTSDTAAGAGEMGTLAVFPLPELDEAPGAAHDVLETTSRSSTDQGCLDEAGVEAKGPREANTPLHPPDTSSASHEDTVKFSRIEVIQEPGKSSAGVARVLSIAQGSVSPGTRMGDHRHKDYQGVDNAPPIKFSHVTIVDEPGGKSSGVSQALRANKPEGSGRAETRVMPRQLLYQQESVATSNNEHKATGERSVSLPANQAPILSSRIPSSLLGIGTGVGARYEDRDERVRLEDGVAPESAAREQLHGNAECLDESTPQAPGVRDLESGTTSEQMPRHGVVTASSAGNNVKADERTGSKHHVPLGAIVRLCLREPILAQCQAVNSAALTYLVQGAGAMGLLISLRMFLLGLNGGFLHDFTLRLLQGLYDGVDWLRPSNINAAFSASATISGLESAPLFHMFQYEVDSTCGGVHGSGGATRLCSASSPEGVGGEDAGRGEAKVGIHSRGAIGLERYSPTALSFVSPVLGVKWPLGVLLPVGALRIYTVIHRALFRHHLALHRLGRLRLVLRELDLALGMSVRTSGRGGKRRGGGEAKRVAGSTDRTRLHWLHLFRHEMQHMADSLQVKSETEAMDCWSDLRGD